MIKTTVSWNLLYSAKLWWDKTLVDLELQEKSVEKILAVDHANNSTIQELTTFGK